jgi:hypothetical protein
MHSVQDDIHLSEKLFSTSLLNQINITMARSPSLQNIQRVGSSQSHSRQHLLLLLGSELCLCCTQMTNGNGSNDPKDNQNECNTLTFHINLRYVLFIASCSGIHTWHRHSFCSIQLQHKTELHPVKCSIKFGLTQSHNATTDPFAFYGIPAYSSCLMSGVNSREARGSVNAAPIRLHFNTLGSIPSDCL